jgi:hypothetical protein
MDTNPSPDEMREALHRLIDQLSAEALLVLWRFMSWWVAAWGDLMR